jgi:hypothetical protein
MNGEFDRARALIADARATYDELGLELLRIGCDETASSVEVLGGAPAAAVRLLRQSYETLAEGGYGHLRDAYGAMLALLLALTGEVDDARGLIERSESGGASHEPRLLAARALVEDDSQLAREAAALADDTDELNLRAELHLVLARVLGDDEELETARRLYLQKGNVAAAEAARLWSLHP